MVMPSLFIRRTVARPRSVSPPSRSSRSPEPSPFDSLYVMPMTRTPKPYRTSTRSTSSSIIVAHSSVETSAHFPAGFARSRSAFVSAR